ncbi:MAG: T9SS type A sorting domain-containing protein [Saprospiraceae bacterium]
MYPKYLLTLTFSIFFLLTLPAQWQPSGLDLLPDTQRVASISVLNEDVVWGISYYDRTPAPVPSTTIPWVFHTKDSGEAWEVYSILEAEGRICQDIFGVNDSTAWITTNGLTSDSLRGLFKTIDGGKSWTEKFDGAAGGGFIHFFDDTSGIAIHDQFMIHTIDGGENWENLSPLELPLGVSETSLYTAANNALATVGDTLWFGTTRGHVLRSHNRGIDWEVLETPFENKDVIFSTAFRNSQEGMIISYASLFQDVISFSDSTKIALTFDGGDTWELADTLFDFKVSCMTAIPGSELKFMGATNGLSTISTDTAQTWQNFSFRPYNAVDFFSSELGWVGNSQTSLDFPATMYKWEGIVSSNHTISKKELKINFFPNPFSESFQLKMDIIDFEKYKKDDLTLDVFDILGKKIMSKNLTSAQSNIQFPTTSNGIYFYVLKTKNNILSNGNLMLHR